MFLDIVMVFQVFKGLQRWVIVDGIIMSNEDFIMV